MELNEEKQEEELTVTPEEELPEDVDIRPWTEKPEEDWTTDDAIEAKKAFKTLAFQKEHWRNKATTPKPIPVAEPVPETNKEKSIGITNEDDILDKAALIAQGVSKNIIKEASVLAKAKGISFADAMSDPLIEAYAEKINSDAKRERAQLGASKSKGEYKSVDLTQVVGMPEEEHRKAIGM